MSAASPLASSVRWSRVLLLVIVLLGTAELGSRLAVRHFLGRPFESFDRYVFTGFGVYRQNPRFTHPKYVHNSVGFRNTREFAIEKPEKTLRVLMLGASVLYSGAGFGAERIGTDETISAYLDAELRQLPELRGYDVEVINASVNRHGIHNALALYVGELSKYRSDIVLVFGTANLGRWEFSGGGRVFQNPERLTREELLLNRLANEATLDALVEKAIRVVVNRSAFAAGSYRLVDGALKRINGFMGSVQKGSSTPRTIASPEELEWKIRHYLAGLGALVTHIEVLGAQPIVFWEHYLLAVEGIKPFSPFEQEVANRLEAMGGGFSPERIQLKSDLRDRVAEFLSDRGVPLIDPLDAMRDFSESLYIDYLHYTAEGNRWVADLLADDLRPWIRDWVAQQPGA